MCSRALMPSPERGDSSGQDLPPPQEEAAAPLQSHSVLAPMSCGALPWGLGTAPCWCHHRRVSHQAKHLDLQLRVGAGHGHLWPQSHQPSPGLQPHSCVLPSAGRAGTFTFPSSFTLLLRSSKGLERAESGARVSVLPWEGPANLSGVKDDISPRTPTWCDVGVETGDPDTE